MKFNLRPLKELQYNHALIELVYHTDASRGLAQYSCFWRVCVIFMTLEGFRITYATKGLRNIHATGGLAHYSCR